MAVSVWVDFFLLVFRVRCENPTCKKKINRPDRRPPSRKSAWTKITTDVGDEPSTISSKPRPNKCPRARNRAFGQPKSSVFDEWNDWKSKFVLSVPGMVSGAKRTAGREIRIFHGTSATETSGRFYSLEMCLAMVKHARAHLSKTNIASPVRSGVGKINSAQS